MGLATGVVLTTTGFLLGAQFTHWSVDHRILWNRPISHQTIYNSLVYYSHLSHKLIGTDHQRWVLNFLHLIALITLIGLLSKLRTSGIAVVFDLASLVLLITSIIIHTTHVIPLLTTIPNTALGFNPSQSLTVSEIPNFKSTTAIIRTIQSITSLHAIISVTLTGLIALQLAQIAIERSLARAQVINSNHLTPISLPARVTILKPSKSSTPTVVVKLSSHNPLHIQPMPTQSRS